MNDALAHLIRWGESQPLVRAMLLTSTRAIPNAAVDLFSDYDVILALRDVRPFFTSRDWLAAFGEVLALYRDPLEPCQGGVKSAYVVQFVGGLKIDFSLWPVDLLRQVASAAELPEEFDAGYRILLDKDGLTVGLKPPTYHAYIPHPPDETEYRKMIEEAMLEATYVARYLWRGDLMAARFILDSFMKHEHLLPVLQWHFEMDLGWSARAGLYGRGLQKVLRPDMWAELESTYTGPGLEENWQALLATLALLHKAATEVGERLGFAYPDEMERRTREYIHQIMRTPRS
jgi:aminoglycoside 6-adenylyltransferase